MYKILTRTSLAHREGKLTLTAYQTIIDIFYQEEEMISSTKEIINAKKKNLRQWKIASKSHNELQKVFLSYLVYNIRLE